MDWKIIIGLLLPLSCAAQFNYRDLAFVKNATTAAAETTAPLLLATSSVDSTGTNWLLRFNENVYTNASLAGLVAPSNSALGTITNLTFVTGSGSNALHFYNSPQITSNGVVTYVSFTNSANAIEDLAGNDLASTNVVSVVNNSTVGGGSCVTVIQSYSSLTGSDISLGDGNAYMREHLFQFRGSNTVSVCSAAVMLKKTGTPAFNFRSRLFADSANTPGSQLGASSSVSANTALTSSYAYYTNSISASIVSGTMYWISIECDANGSAGNTLDIQGEVPAGTFRFYDDTNGDVFLDWGASAMINCILYSL